VLSWGSFSLLAVFLSGSPVSVFLSAVYCWWANVFCGEEENQRISADACCCVLVGDLCDEL